MTKLQTPICIAVLGLCCAACVDPGVDADDAEPAEPRAPIDVSDAPERGGPGVTIGDDGREPSLEDSPNIGRILSITDPASVPDGVARTHRFRRLDLDEYDRSVGDLLGLDVGAVSDSFPEELPTLEGYFARGDLRATDRLMVELQQAAEILAERAVIDAAAYARVVPCVSADSACRDEFLRAFGLRAYRRPLSELDVSRYQTLFDQGAELVASGGSFSRRRAARGGDHAAISKFPVSRRTWHGRHRRFRGTHQRL